MTAPPTVQFTVGNGFDLAGINALVRDFNLLGPRTITLSTTSIEENYPLTSHQLIESISHDAQKSRIILTAADSSRVEVYYRSYGEQAYVRYLLENGFNFPICVWIGIRNDIHNDLWQFQERDKSFYPRPWRRCRELGIRTLLDVSLNMDRFIDPRFAHYLQYHPLVSNVKLPPLAPGFKPKSEFSASDYKEGRQSCFDVIMDAVHFVVTAAIYNGGSVTLTGPGKIDFEEVSHVAGMGFNVKLGEEEKSTPCWYLFGRLFTAKETRSISSVELAERGGSTSYHPTPIPNEIELEFFMRIFTKGNRSSNKTIRFIYGQGAGIDSENENYIEGLKLGASPSEIVRIVDESRSESISSRSGPKRRNPEVEADRIGNNVLSLFNQMGNYRSGMTVDEKANALVSRNTIPAIRFGEMSSEERKNLSISYHPVSYLFESSPVNTTDHAPLNWIEEGFTRQRQIADRRWRDRNRMLLESIQTAVAQFRRRNPSVSSSSGRFDPFPLF
jgi:hypothetical protein